jgi:uncharacterized membrane protein
VRPALLLALAAGVAGLGISIYLTVVHFSAGALVCSASGAVNCEAVLTSPYGVIAGSVIPTSAAGALWFAVSTGWAAARLLGAGGGVATAHLAWAVIGLAVVLGLVYIEIDRLGVICAWCTAAHLCVLATLLAVIWARE